MLAGTDFYARHRDVLEQRRGAGYWLWKPYIILEAIKASRPGDTVVYSDCLRKPLPIVRRPLDWLIQWADSNGGMLPGSYIPVHGPNRIWTKRDCFVLMDCDSPEYYDIPQVQASFSVWRNQPASIEFLESWLAYASDRRVLTDDPNTCGLPNLEGFREHRHDQSILTLLAKRDGIRALGDPEDNGCSQLQSKSMDEVLDHVCVPKNNAISLFLFEQGIRLGKGLRKKKQQISKA